MKTFFRFVCLFSVFLFPQFSHAATAHCDFNGDGFNDIAIGVPGDDVNGNRAGAVSVIYGKAGGLSAANNQLWNRDSTNVLGDAVQADQFGYAVACGDFNGDGNDDLAIGAPNSDNQQGSVTVLYGQKKWRLSATGNQLWSQASPGILGDPADGDLFGWSLASGDFNGDGYADLAIGVLDDFVSDSAQTGGSVQIIYGSSTGLTSAGNQLWTEDSPGIAHTAQPGASFGRSLVAADFGNDTASHCYDDLAIGVPDNMPGGVHVLYGSASGLSATNSDYFAEGLNGIGGTQLDSRFGWALAATSFRGLSSVCGTQKIADLVVGASEENQGGHFAAGAVFVIYGTDTGLTAAGNQRWTQDSPGIAGTANDLDLFGFAVATGQTSSGPYLAIGVPRDTVGSFTNAGVVHLLFTDPATGLVTATGSKYYTQNTPGIKDKSEISDQFGYSVATGDFDADGNDDLVVGVPGDPSGSNFGAINVLYGADTIFTQYFHQDKVDMKGVEETFDNYGFSLAP